MKSTPLVRYRCPRYPTKREVRADRSLLKNRSGVLHLDKTEMAGALALFLSACNGSGIEPAVSAVGCMSILPPVFMSEEEALDIVVGEAARQGLMLQTGWRAREAMQLPIDADAVNLEHNVAIEFVSHDDCIAFYSTAQDGGVVEDGAVPEDAAVEYRGQCNYQWQQIGEELAVRVQRANSDVHFRAITDPMSDYLPASEQYLRDQVTNFVEWLRAIGEI